MYRYTILYQINGKHYEDRGMMDNAHDVLDMFHTLVKTGDKHPSSYTIHIRHTNQ